MEVASEAIPKLSAPVVDELTAIEPVPVELPMVLPVTLPILTAPAETYIPQNTPGFVVALLEEVKLIFEIVFP